MRSHTIVTSLATLLLLLLAPGRAGAASSATELDRVAIASFEGPQADRIQGAVETGLMTHYYVVPDFKVTAEARRQGIALRDATDFSAVGRALAVRAFVSAEVQRRSNWQVHLTVRRGDTGAPVGRIVLADKRLDRLESLLATRASARLGSLVDRAPEEIAAAEGEAPLAGTAAGEAAPEAGPAGGAFETPLWDLAVGGRLFSRSFAYAQNLSGLPGYELGRAFSTTLDGSFRPGALVAPRWRPLVVTGALEYGLAIGSRTAGSEARASSGASGYRLGLGYDLGWKTLTATPGAGYAVQSFTSGADAAAAAPDVRYRMLALGAGGRWAPAAGIAFLLRADYLRALSIGGLGAANRFPHATAQGLEVEAVAVFVVMPTLELRVSFGVRRLGLDMNSVPGDRWVAGGAIDQSAWTGLGVAYRR